MSCRSQRTAEVNGDSQVEAQSSYRAPDAGIETVAVLPASLVTV